MKEIHNDPKLILLLDSWKAELIELENEKIEYLKTETLLCDDDSDLVKSCKDYEEIEWCVKKNDRCITTVYAKSNILHKKIYELEQILFYNE